MAGREDVENANTDSSSTNAAAEVHEKENAGEDHITNFDIDVEDNCKRGDGEECFRWCIRRFFLYQYLCGSLDDPQRYESCMCICSLQCCSACCGTKGMKGCCAGTGGCCAATALCIFVATGGLAIIVPLFIAAILLLSYAVTCGCCCVTSRNDLENRLLDCGTVCPCFCCCCMTGEDIARRHGYDDE